MPGKTRKCLREKTLYNVMRSNLSVTDKNCIKEVFDRFDRAIIPPCKVGDTVYILFGDKPLETRCIGYFVGELFCQLKLEPKNDDEAMYAVDFDDVGKFAFLTLEEAEQALNNIENGNS